MDNIRTEEDTHRSGVINEGGAKYVQILSKIDVKLSSD
jgi:hypothetical protein